MQASLFTTLYREKRPERDHELLACLEMNRSLRSLDRIFVLEEPPYRLTADAKIHVIRVMRRPTFNDVLDVIRQETGPDDLNVLANTDIYLDEQGVRFAQRSLKADECYALGRWDIVKGGTRARMYGPDFSQDVWCFRGMPRPISAPFYMGKLRCDNRLAYELAAAGYILRNPSRRLRTYHLHESGVRNYRTTSDDHVPGPYLLVPTESPSLWHAAAWTLQRAVRRGFRFMGVEIPFPYERRCAAPNGAVQLRCCRPSAIGA